jgi:heavy metal sensor kinase
MSLKSKSIRFRLTLWYSGIMLVILGLVSAGIYFFTWNRLETMARSKLDNAYGTVETILTVSGGDLMDVMHLGQSFHFQLTQGDKVVYQTEAWKDTFASLRDLTYDPYKSWRTSDGRLFLLKREIIPKYDYELTYGQDITSVRESQKTLVAILIAGIPVAFILALLGGFLLAGRALSPVKNITTKAREITAESLSKRLPVENPKDEIGRLAVVFNDTLARLEASFDQLRRFTADASHELRTPLTSIRSVGEVALQSPADKRADREAISSMLEETERLTGLVDNLLTLTRGESGKDLLHPRPTDINSLVKEVLDELRVLAEEKEQNLSMEGESSVTANIDASTIRQAVMNVVHNAIRYTERRGHIKVVLTAGKKGEVVMEIIDNGPGIPKDERSRVFERFYRIDKARSREEGGAGLGLAIAHWAVEANHGKIEFCDLKGPGSCCRITLG